MSHSTLSNSPLKIPKVTFDFSPPSTLRSIGNINNDSMSTLWRYQPSEAQSARLDRQGTLRNEILLLETSERASSSSSPVIQEKVDDSLPLVHRKIQEQLDLLTASPDYQYFSSAFRGELEEEPPQKKGQPNFLIQSFQTILHLYQLDFKVYEDYKQDSAISIEPVEMRDLILNQYITILLFQITKFPYTFFQKLKLRLFSFCRSVTLDNRYHKSVYYKRVLSGLFEVENATNQNAIKLHFYKFLCYHIAQKSKSETFTAEWKKLNMTGFVYTKDMKVHAEHPEFNKGFLNEACKTSLLNDQAQIFERLMADHIKILGHSDAIIRKKGYFIMNALLTVDANFAEMKGWQL